MRVGPDNADVNDRSAAHQIHVTKGGFKKSNFYSTGGKVQSMFSARDRAFHSSRRRLLGPCFMEASIKSLYPIIHQMARLCMEKMLEEATANDKVDLLKWATLFAMDVVGQLSFGESFGMIESGQKNQFAEDVANAGSILPLRTAFPTLIRIGAYLPLPFFWNIAQSRQRIMAYNRQRVARYLELVKTNSNKSRSTIFASLIRGNEIELSELELTVEVQSYITAGTDTTAVTLTYLVWAVCRDKHIQKRLVHELQGAPDDLKYEDLCKLPYLTCVVQEALRRYGAAPGALPREVPSGGATLSGYYIPAGTVVSTQAYSMHRDPSIFPEPEL